MLLQQPAGNFTVEEIGWILNPGSGEEDGPRLLRLARRVGIEPQEGAKP